MDSFLIFFNFADRCVSVLRKTLRISVEIRTNMGTWLLYVLLFSLIFIAMGELDTPPVHQDCVWWSQSMHACTHTQYTRTHARARAHTHTHTHTDISSRQLQHATSKGVLHLSTHALDKVLSGNMDADFDFLSLLSCPV